MKEVLILGSGGREHALAWKLAQDAQVAKVHVYPGNVGMLATAKVFVHLEGVLNKDELCAFINKLAPDLIVVGPENILAMGVADWPEIKSYPLLGPSAWCAQLESSKCWAFEKMLQWQVPMPRGLVVESVEAAKKFIEESFEFSGGVVLKADGLKSGKGVVVCKQLDQAWQTLSEYLSDQSSPLYSPRVLLQQLLPGPEVSLFALVDGERYLPLGAVRDYKRKYDDNQGPNTGGMGCVSVELDQLASDEKELGELYQKFFGRVVAGFKQENTPYRGFLFAGLMRDEQNQWRAIEYNVRMGDPETQTLLPLLQEDFFDLLKDAALGELKKNNLERKAGVSLHVTMTSGGYSELRSPLSLRHPIRLPSDLGTQLNDELALFWAGVGKEGNQFVNTGGRVLGVTAHASTIEECREKAYHLVRQIHFNHGHFRQDIGR